MDNGKSESRVVAVQIGCKGMGGSFKEPRPGVLAPVPRLLVVAARPMRRPTSEAGLAGSFTSHVSRALHSAHASFTTSAV